MSYEPPQSRGEWRDPTPRVPSLPPRKDRWAVPDMHCAHCGKTSQTSDARCPVCDAPYPRRGVLARLFHRA